MSNGGNTLPTGGLPMFYGSYDFWMLGVLAVVIIFHGKCAPTIRKSQPEPGNSKKSAFHPHQTTKRFAPKFVQPPKKQQKNPSWNGKNTNSHHISTYYQMSKKKHHGLFPGIIWHSKNKTTTTHQPPWHQTLPHPKTPRGEGRYRASESLRPNFSVAFRTPKSDRWPARTAPRSCAHRGPVRGDRCV